MSISIADCGHTVTNDGSLTHIRFNIIEKGNDGPYPAVMIATVCLNCAAIWETNPLVIKNSNEELKWLSGKGDMSASINESTAKILGAKEQQEIIEQLKTEMLMLSSLQQEIQMQNIPSGNVLAFLEGKLKGLDRAHTIFDKNIRLSENTGK